MGTIEPGMQTLSQGLRNFEAQLKPVWMAYYGKLKSMMMRHGACDISLPRG